MSNSNEKKLTVFVHRASEYLTDHAAHGEGLICFSLLNGLAQRGHKIFAFTNRAAIREHHPNLHIREEPHRIPANSLAPWEYSWRAEQWFRHLLKTESIDLVWRMNPLGGAACPYPPYTAGKPLVVGPLYYSWPLVDGVHTARPRVGMGIKSLTDPIGLRGWQRTIEQTALLFCATEQHAAEMRPMVKHGRTMGLPLIVEPLSNPHRQYKQDGGPFSLLFVAHLALYKNPRLFCETIRLLRTQGLAVMGTLIGDGPEREALQVYCRENELQDAIYFAGKVPNEEVYRRLQQADALVSLSQGEPYGRSIVEAMSVGTPVICHRSGGPADFITDGVNGLLVDALRPEAYAQAVRTLFDTPELWETLSRNALCASEQWRSEMVLTRLEQALQDV